MTSKLTAITSFAALCAPCMAWAQQIPAPAPSPNPPAQLVLVSWVSIGPAGTVSISVPTAQTVIGRYPDVPACLNAVKGIKTDPQDKPASLSLVYVCVPLAEQRRRDRDLDRDRDRDRDRDP